MCGKGKNKFELGWLNCQNQKKIQGVGRLGWIIGLSRNEGEQLIYLFITQRE